MELIGMLDSPYVRRVAIAFQFLEIEFTHRSLSVFRDYDAFQQLSPLVKAPSLICDNGAVLTDSNLIIDYGIALSTSPRRLIPCEPLARQESLALTGTALVAYEKSVQIIYERHLRPAETLHQPWLTRVTEQLLMALNALESSANQTDLNIQPESIGLAEITLAVAWKFVQEMIPDVIKGGYFPTLTALSQRAEQLSYFQRAPFGEQDYPVNPT